MIQDRHLQAAVSRINQRSERQQDIDKLKDTYVDIGLFAQLQNRNHQIFYGRRGTGKTHVMKVLSVAFAEDRKATVIYIDCRTLGSTNQFADVTLPIGRRCLSLFRDVLLEIHNGLLEHIIECPAKRADEALAAADALAAVITEPLETLRAERVTTEVGSHAEIKSSISVGSTISSAALTIDGKRDQEQQEKNTSKTNAEYAVSSEDKIIFPDLHSALRRVLELADSQLVVLIDEWSSLPVDVQPYLAEFLKRGLLPLQSATVKISALEYRCRFSVTQDHGYIGFELGADIATAPDLDDYFVYERSPDQITDTYADVIYQHLSSELPENYLKQNHSVSNGKQLASRLFTERSTCAELAK